MTHMVADQIAFFHSPNHPRHPYSAAESGEKVMRQERIQLVVDRFRPKPFHEYSFIVLFFVRCSGCLC